MAADVGLIKSVSQAFKSEEANSKLGENLRYGFGKIAEGITKGTELKLKKQKEEALKKEKQEENYKNALLQRKERELSNYGGVTSLAQYELISSGYSNTREEVSGLMKENNTLSPTDPKYSENLNRLTAIRSDMDMMVRGIESINEMEGVTEALDKDTFAKFNTQETLDFTNRLIAKDYSLVYDNGTVKLDFGDGSTMTQEEALQRVAKIPDLSVMDEFTRISETVEEDASEGKNINQNKVNVGLGTLREELIEGGSKSDSKLLTMLTEPVLYGVKPDDDPDVAALVESFQNAKTAEQKIEARQKMVEHLLGTGEESENGVFNNGYLGRSIADYHKSAKEQYDAALKAKNENIVALNSSKNGGKGKTGTGTSTDQYRVGTGNEKLDDLSYFSTSSESPLTVDDGDTVRPITIEELFANNDDDFKLQSLKTDLKKYDGGENISFDITKVSRKDTNNYNKNKFGNKMVAGLDPATGQKALVSANNKNTTNPQNLINLQRDYGNEQIIKVVRKDNTQTANNKKMVEDNGQAVHRGEFYPLIGDPMYFSSIEEFQKYMEVEKEEYASSRKNVQLSKDNAIEGPSNVEVTSNVEVDN